MSSNQELPLIFFIAVVYGMRTVSSWSWPETDSPLGRSVPTILQGMSLTRMTFPIGSSTPKS